MMRKTLLVPLTALAMSGMGITSLPALAADVCARSAEHQLENAASTRQEITVAVQQRITECSEKAVDIVTLAIGVAPELASDITLAAIDAAPDQIAEIVEAAVAAAPDQAEEIVSAVTDRLPTASGAASSTIPAPASLGVPRGGSGGGTGGGTTASSS
ncbi:hypothetical protein [Pseudomonas profundi]|uniref:hypothetical protein n=1 Tax=Pseudomonas profundi TaxID=1981513 RepID=UPI00123AD4CF|nr:hypothetical protein [Pseudomonas profundi]